MLNNKTALVTGSTSGIGLGIAKCLARQGANIVLNGFGDVEAAQAEIAALPDQHGDAGSEIDHARKGLAVGGRRRIGQLRRRWGIGIRRQGPSHLFPIPSSRFDSFPERVRSA